MGKRSHDEATSMVRPGDGASRDQKRAKTSNGSDERSVSAFIDFIAKVPAMDLNPDTDSGVLQPCAKENLKSLSRTLLHFLPAIKALAEEEEQGTHPPASEPSAAPMRSSGKESVHMDPDANSPSATRVHSMNKLTKWTVDDISSVLPPLPPILDSALETASFTHPGQAKRTTDMHYERLEWIGDAYIYIISCSFIYATFPTLSPGKCSQIREVLVKNKTLRDYSLRYGFDKRADFPAEFGFGGRLGGTTVNEGERSKVLADLFEAYVGAVVLSDPHSGFDRAAAWLKALWAGTIAKQIKEAGVLQQRAAELPPKNQLANLIMAKGIRLRYEDAPPSGSKQKVSKESRLPLYTVNVYLDGWGETNKLLGWGTAPNKGEAGHRAALCAMDNKKLIQVYVERKRAHLAAVEAQKKEE